VSVAVTKHQNFVGGEWIDATGAETQIKHVMAKLD
jgi:hypothetical protein